MLPMLISALMFLLVVLVLGITLRPRAAIIHERVDDYLLSAPAPPTKRQDVGFAERVLFPIFRALGRLVWAVTPAGFLAKCRARLDMAGNPPHLGVLEYIGMKVLSAGLLIPAGCWVFLHVWSDPIIIAWGVSALIIALGIWLPDIILQRVIEGRQASINRTLPDVLDLLVVSVEAGIGFDGAMQKVVEKGKGPLCQELSRVLEQVRLGKSRAEALRDMGQRTQVTDLISFVAAITQAETLGTSLVKVLRTQANTARERRALRAREAAAKLPVKLLFPLVFFIFPSLFVVILGPGVIRFVELFKVLGK